MSENQPPAGTPEYLDHAGGAPIPPEPTPPTDGAGGRRSRRGWFIGGGVLALVGLGAGAWAALSFFEQGAQPAEALPSTTVGYLSIDLDPAGGQKIDAFRTLNKFPEFKDEVGVDSVDELRHKLGDALVSDSGCDNLDYDQDIDPWLGDRAAVALVDMPDAHPDTVVVVQVKDEDAARKGLAALNACSGTGDSGVVVKDGWAVLADTQQNADDVVAATDHGTLADDATYQKWTKAVGDAGVINAYASPDAGRVLVDELGGLFGTGLSPFGDPLGTTVVVPDDASSASPVPSAFHATTADGSTDPFTDRLSGFKGGAATLRFTGDGLELAIVGDAGSGLSDLTGTTGGELVQRLPDDTAAAAGVSYPKGWVGRQLDQLSGVFGGGLSSDDTRRELSEQTGLDVPADIETLLGSGISLSVGDDIDLEAAENGDRLSGLPIGVTIKGDPAAIERVLTKLRAKFGDEDLGFLDSDSSGDLVVIGPTATYRQHLLDGGHLGDDDTFRGVVPDAGDASAVFYVSMDALEPAITKAAAGDQESLDNITPLRAIGLSTRNDDDVFRFSFKLTTN
jgi:hypothetical protein